MVTISSSNAARVWRVQVDKGQSDEPTDALSSTLEAAANKKEPCLGSQAFYLRRESGTRPQSIGTWPALLRKHNNDDMQSVGLFQTYGRGGKAFG
jgi:hypothetical protein